MEGRGVSVHKLVTSIEKSITSSEEIFFYEVDEVCCIFEMKWAVGPSVSGVNCLTCKDREHTEEQSFFKPAR